MAEERVERRLAAILAADVAGYSRLMEQDEAGTLARLKSLRRDLIDPKIAAHKGRIVKTTGDGLLIEFPSVIEAVACAVAVQRAMPERNAAIPEHRRIEFRIGINVGDIIVDGDDIFGDGVNVAARLEGLAEPGGICVSGRVQEDAAGKLDLDFADMGDQQLRNIARPVRVFAIRVGRAASPMPNTRPAAAPSTNAPSLSIVVLPFINLSNDAELEFFADGVTDDVTTDLSRITDSFVISRSTAFTFKGKPIDVKQIGRDLSVRYVLEGSVRRAGDRVRINVQLIDAESGAHLWAERFDADLARLAATEEEITGRIARSLNMELVEAAGRRSERERGLDPDVQDLVRRGWAWFYRPRSRDSLERAQQAFERALELDPRSIEAQVGTAQVLSTQMTHGLRRVSTDDQAHAESLLKQVLEREDNNSTAHHALGLLRRTQNRLAEAKIEFETAVKLDRNNAWAISEIGQVLINMGQPEAAIPYIERAMRLNPHDNQLAQHFYLLGQCHVLLGEIDHAKDFLMRARAANPRLWYIHYQIAACFPLLGNLEEARAGVPCRPDQDQARANLDRPAARFGAMVAK